MKIRIFAAALTLIGATTIAMPLKAEIIMNFNLWPSFCGLESGSFSLLGTESPGYCAAYRRGEISEPYVVESNNVPAGKFKIFVGEDYLRLVRGERYFLRVSGNLAPVLITNGDAYGWPLGYSEILAPEKEVQGVPCYGPQDGYLISFCETWGTPFVFFEGPGRVTGVYIERYVPEPATLVLIAAGALGLAAVRRRKIA